MTTQSLLILLLLALPLAVQANPPPKPAKPVGKVVRTTKPSRSARASRPAKTVQLEATKVEAAIEHAQQPVTANPTPARATLIQPKADFNRAILRSGSNL